ncbi:SRPBCC family protein [Mycobacterium sp. 94-17]|uniref:SRPBCC family protein n=1 Tax=Mycobacterium sp. 94-17 TaxID=2986147 RepID=UPI002D1E5944|nr:SRPBCC family protein [Mycobacterium sp. 94-17]MEB4207731.1 hypothetical protein [Mycobacterium sp. 94-17]
MIPPGECVAYLTYGTIAPLRTDEERNWHAYGMDAACLVSRDEDFPAAEACQRGLAAGVGHVLFGRNEPLLHHFAVVWADALTRHEAEVSLSAASG